MFRQIINEKYFCGLDVGAQKIKASILEAKDNQLEILGIYEHKTHGFLNGSVSELGEFSECIHKTVNPLLEKTGVKLKEIHLGLGGELVETRLTNTVVPLIDKGNKVITAKDVRFVNEQCRLLSIKMDEEVLDDIPQQYVVDDVNTALNPKGLYGRKLGVTSLMILSNTTRLRNIIKGVNQAGYDVGKTYFNPMVAADISLTDQQKLEGCVLLDIGSEVTSVLIFKDRVLKYFDKIACGGDTFTMSIARELGLPFDLAEEVKISYADVSGQDNFLDEEILIKKENAYIPIRREIIVKAIKPHIDDLVKALNECIKKSDVSAQLNSGIVALGGGALLPGLVEQIAEITNFSVQLGDVNLTMQKRLRNPSAFVPVIGLAQRGFKETFAYTLSNTQEGNWMKRIGNKIKDFYQEYF